MLKHIYTPAIQKTCLIVYMYYHVSTCLNEMKILPSSPYAIFNVNEWDSLTNSRKKYSKNSKCNFQKYYYKNLKKYNVKNSIRGEIKKTKLIQLSFA